MKSDAWIPSIQDGKWDTYFQKLYGADAVPAQRQRYVRAIRQFVQTFPEHAESQISVFSAPGRTEIGGNHTDHQYGCVLAAAIQLDVVAVVSFRTDRKLRLQSEGYPMDTIDLSRLEAQPSEQGTSAALIRGIAAKLAQNGVQPSGFDAYTTSAVLTGSGLSSSAAFEILLGTIFNEHDNDGAMTPVALAQAGQYAENIYYGKQSGLMDQTACASGGVVYVDFQDTTSPKVTAHAVDFARYGYAICITDTKGSHADLTDDYTAIPTEMRQVAAQFGQTELRGVSEEAFYAAIPQLRRSCSDRAILRAMHFFAENRRAGAQAQALESGDMAQFLTLVQESGASSAELLQNLYSASKPTAQEIPLAIAVSKRLLAGAGAVRVHGGGFAGTIQAFVPLAQVAMYTKAMEQLFGEDSCYALRIRPVGGVEMKEELQ